tara:strand:+ start:249 stop:410 length:162 start_codon:yes stop_codon:yes gene_type:complete
MFEKEELALIHKSISELTIKGFDAHVVSVLLNKVATEHAKPESVKSEKTKIEK